MSELIHKYRLWFYIGIIPYFALLFFLVYPTNYTTLFPGEITPIERTVEVVDAYQSKGSFNSTSVWEIRETTLFQRLVFQNLDYIEVYETPKSVSDLSDYDYTIQGKIMHDSSVFSSIICAYTKAGYDILYEHKGFYVFESKNDNFKIGDVLVSNNKEEARAIIKNYQDGVKLWRNNAEITIYPDNMDDVTFAYECYVINESSIAEKPYTIHPSESGGPSGGFLQTLALYDSLTAYDYTHGYKIAGTGTIDVEGNVGAIGGVNEKVYAAYYNKVDYFFIPKENYEEALKTYQRLKTKMKLIMVETLDDAIAYLEAIE